MSGCETYGVAIALDRGFPEDEPPGNYAGQHRHAILDRPLEARSARQLFPIGAVTESHSASQDEQVSQEPLPRDNRATGNEEFNTAGFNELSFDATLVKEAFARVETHASQALEYFYAHLFVQHPELRAMFPLTMSEHRQRVFAALARLVWSVDSPAALNAYAGQLGRDHRKFGVKERHYSAFFDALLTTVQYFSGTAWTAQTQAAFSAALDYTAAVMLRAAALDAEREPPWWVGEVVRHQLRGPSLAVLTIRPDQPLRYRAGQYVSVQVARWPRIWRDFSIANAPRADGQLDLHVRAVAGGMVSNALVHHLQAGDSVLLGPARGEMTAPGDPERDLVCIAGGTGLAPLKAIIEEVISAARTGRRPSISLFFGAQREDELYDMPDLRVMESAYQPLTVIPVVSADPGFAGIRGLLPPVVRQRASCAGKEIYICGPDAMVREARRLLARRSAAQFIHHDPPRTPGEELHQAT
jgi:NAD(P)H-flavin reductase/hemoglobin-like flavoprotein